MKKYGKWIWVGLGVVALLLRWLLSPAQIEQLYSRGLFKSVRWLLDHTVGILPMPIGYILVIILIIGLLWRTVDLFRSKRTWQQKLKDTGMSTLAFAGAVVFLFLFLWGFNYGRIPLEEQLGLELQPLTLEELESDMKASAVRLAQLRSEISHATDSAVAVAIYPHVLEEDQRAVLENVLTNLGFPDVGEVRARVLRPKGVLLRFSSSGVYFPFTGEGNVDLGLYPLQMPFVLTHELAHGYGFGDEGTCNFLAYLACLESEDPIYRYSGQMAYFRYLASNYLQYKPEEYQEFRADLPKGIQADLNAINANLLEYPDLIPRLQHQAYTTYLKAQGISEGKENYSRILMLVRAWKKREK